MGVRHRRRANVPAAPTDSTLIHLDTNFLIRALMHGTPEQAWLDRWIVDGPTVGISSIAWCEFLGGPIDASLISLAVATLGQPMPLTSDDSALAATLFNGTGRRRGSLLDCMIAAVCLRAGAPIATCNTEDFRRSEFRGLTLANL